MARWVILHSSRRPSASSFPIAGRVRWQFSRLANRGDRPGRESLPLLPLSNGMDSGKSNVSPKPDLRHTRGARTGGLVRSI